MASPIDAVIANRKLRFRFMRHDAWENALFVHWPVDPTALVQHLPRGLEPDLWDGKAWLGLVILTERGVSASNNFLRRLVTPVDHVGANVRTYVKRNGVPGIFFFSLECSSLLATIGARMAGIPYFPADMSRKVDIQRPVVEKVSKAPDMLQQADAHRSWLSCFNILNIHGRSLRVDPGASFEAASTRRLGGSPSVQARWKLQGKADKLMENETFRKQGEFFVERYSVYACWPLRSGPVLLRGDIQHAPWVVEPATLEALDAEQLFQAAGLEEFLPLQDPHVCFSRGVGPIDFWMLEPV
mmetsp:Transcript_68119/g.142294  ORF Transcript_68119/g.142294 Transcript_68119/m.142294 type:complete len:299 (+) Transcript_68119:206-1102(+)|eukprot:CAMPEP_0206481960 /NCGR_PEP_ID=MMETSP0324_2-20121206/38526_1 /ASSEMBLY_ACC=CAM_ASM_000836 /TAXON_ID=2866 /ORGANISM="Crypthecodinium cohnii, Strain Seligo" /LENGTH=298 /DNA_ID=CAMNT_0053959689 /DNA_START=140 /DNA_END=1036 /DNA_ORIENTATION=-